MSKKQEEENQDVIVDVQEVYSKTEQFVEGNKKNLSMVIGGIVLVIAAYLGYTKFYIAPMEVEAQSSMFMAEKYFEKDSLEKAINGDGLNPGFVEIVDEYGGTKAANLANYYLGLSYLKTGDYEGAIEALSNFSSDDVLVSAMAIGATGDAYMELQDFDNASSYYVKAAKHESNNLTTPMFLFKAGIAFEENGNMDKAIEQYNIIKKEYPESSEARTIDKYITRIETAQK